MNLAEAEALCAHLEERSDIAYAWGYGVWNVDTTADETQIVLIGAWFNERGDKAITMKDAMYILRYADELNLGYEPTWYELLEK